MEVIKLIVNDGEENVRLDKYLSDQIDELSRAFIQQAIKEGHVLVNGEGQKGSYKIKVDDIIDVQMQDNVDLDIKPVNLNLDIVYEDSDVVVVNKPKGLVVHPGAGTNEVTLVSGLLYQISDLSGINGVNRPGIVHRIDKDTSGLIIVAKNDQAHNSLASQLKDKTLGRKYLALVHGVLAHDFGTIDAPIGRDDRDRTKMCVTNKNSKNALTNFKVVKRYKNYTLVECVLSTGRTHQIRVHMQYIGYPLVGDPKYSFKKHMDTNGQMLHAFELKFVQPKTKEEIVVNCDLPTDFKDLLERIEEE
ncbi:MAG: RluA family pseudouridine synthase [Erysipelotrichaceae bacterium]